jgi:hypothetical protein
MDVSGELTDTCVIALLDKFLAAHQLLRVFSVLELAVELRIPGLNDYVRKIQNSPNILEDKR